MPVQSINKVLQQIASTADDLAALHKEVSPGGFPAEDAASTAQISDITFIEARIAAIWSQILRIEGDIDRDIDFFDLGGDSIQAVQALSVMQQVFSSDFSLADLLGEKLSIRQLAEQIASELELTQKKLNGGGLGEQNAMPIALVEEQKSPRPRTIARASRQQDLPLSFAQERLWFLDQMEPGNSVYNVACVLQLEGNLNLEALEYSFNQLVRRHEPLRTLFQSQQGHSFQFIAEAAPFHIGFVDLMGVPDALLLAREIARGDANRPFDLASGPLLRVFLARFAHDRQLLVIATHHIVGDGWSIGILLHELTAHYQSYCEGQHPEMPELLVQYADFAVWQREQVRSGALQEHLSYWRKQLEGAPSIIELPFDHQRPGQGTSAGASRTFTFPRELWEHLQELSRRERTTVFMTLLAGFTVLLSRYTGEEDVVLGTPIANRTRPELEGIIGFFVNLLVLRTSLAGHPTFRELLGRVRQTCLSAYAHQDMPFELLAKELQPQRFLSHQPLFQVLFVFQNMDMPGLDLPGVQSSFVNVDRGVTRFDFAVAMAETPSGLQCGIEYSTELFEAETIDRFAQSLRTTLETLVAKPEQRIDELHLISADEQQQIEVWNETGSPSSEQPYIHKVFEAHARNTPDAISLVCDENQLSYSLLNELANQAAHLLQSTGVDSEMSVAVFLERSPESIIALLAIWKIGGVYVPIDTSYPLERIAFMLSDSEAAVLMTTKALASSLLHLSARIVYLDAHGFEVDTCKTRDPNPQIQRDQLAYVIYTSGSMGKPKGVMVPHRGLANLLTVEANALEPHCDSRILQLVSFSFDASLWDVVMALGFGGTLCIVTGEARLPGPVLSDLLRDRMITHATLPPSALAVLPAEDLCALRCITSTGEALTRNVVRRWATGRRIINGYGPTESTVGATLGPCKEEDAVLHIGRPFAGVQVHVLDRHLQITSIGVPGEIHIGGIGVVRGYLNRPDMTAERFIPDPFGTNPGARLYRTGDRARRLADGTIEFLGRIDDQVKLRGFRIELGEIESTLRRCAGVADAVVVVHEFDSQDKRLTAYVVCDAKHQSEGASLNTAELRAQVQKTLPPYMVPAIWIFLPRLPVSTNGKVDRRALPAPDASLSRLHESYRAPEGALEAELARIRSETLGVQQIGRDDNFFSLGGDSILSIQIVARAAQAKIPITAKMLFQHQTVSALAHAIANMEGVNGSAAPVSAVSSRAAAGLDQATIDEVVGAEQGIEGVYGLSPMQEGMLFHSLYAPGSGVYVQQVSVRLRGDLQVERFKQAWEKVIGRHEALRASFHWRATGQPVQVIHETVQAGWTEMDWRGEEEEDKERRLEEWLEEDRRRGMDPGQAPLVRFGLVRWGEEKHQWIFTSHHLLMDGWSLQQVMREVFRVYEGLRRGEEVELGEVVGYREYIEWVQRQDLGKAERYWRRALAGYEPGGSWGLGRRRKEEEGREEEGREPERGSYGQEVVELSAEASQRLQQFCREEQLTLNTVVQGSWGVLLTGYSGEREVVYGMTVAGRPGELKGVERMVGLFINTLPVRLRVERRKSVREWLRGVQEQLAEMREYEYTPLAEIQGWSEVKGGEGLFETLVVFENYPVERGVGEGMEVLGVEGVWVREQTNYGLTLVVVPGRRVRMQVLYERKRYGAGAMKGLLRQLEAVLGQMAADGGRRVGQISMLTEEDR